MRLDNFLTALLPDQSRSQIQRLIKEAACRDRLRASGRAPRSGRPDLRRRRARAVAGIAEAEALPLLIVYEDPDVVVLDKPAGMVVHPAAGHSAGTLVNALLHHVKDLSGVGGELRPGIVHRLDRGTSGLMVVAKNDRAHQELSRQFHDREVEKEYFALVWGVVHAGKRIDAPIGRDPGSARRCRRGRGGRGARSRG